MSLKSAQEKALLMLKSSLKKSAPNKHLLI